MMIKIAEMSPEHYDRKGYVHWKCWQETYAGLMDDRFLANQTLEKCQNIARRWPENTLLAHLDGEVVGFACYGPSRDDAYPDCGEIYAIYLLKEAQGLGIGLKLMDAAMEKLSGCHPIVLWVLKGNNHAIGFYEHYGFHLDGHKKVTPLGTELRMAYSC